jgi:hypothetical protein
MTANFLSQERTDLSLNVKMMDIPGPSDYIPDQTKDIDANK